MLLSRLVPSLLVATVAVGITTAPAEARNANARINTRIVIEDVDFDDFEVVDGVLRAIDNDDEGDAVGTVSGTIAGLPFTTDLANFALELLPDGGPDGGTGACSVLDLELGPIDIDLLGLHVDTSAICLTITAMEGEGLLGDLLCSIAGGDLSLLDGLLREGLPDLLTESMAKATPPATGGGEDEPEDICDGECEILDLAIGPVDLDLLGVNVHLDNCDDGPVQVCISATEGEGLLGDLLCGLAGDGVIPDLGNLADLIDRILDAHGVNLTDKQLDKLVKQVRKLLRDGRLDAKDIEQLIKSVQKLLR